MTTRETPGTARNVGSYVFRLAVLVAAVSLAMPTVASAHGSKHKSFNVTANVVCNPAGNNKYKTKCKKNALVSFAPLFYPGWGSGSVRTVRQPTIWIDTLDSSKSSSSQFDEQFVPSVPSEFDLDF